MDRIPSESSRVPVSHPTPAASGGGAGGTASSDVARVAEAALTAARGDAVEIPPLLHATRKEDLKKVKLLISSGVDVNSSDRSGATALHYAASLGLTEIALELIRAGASVDAFNTKGETPLLQAARKGQAAMVPILAKAGASLEAPTSFSYPPLAPLIEAACGLYHSPERYSQTVIALVEAGANVNVVDLCSHTPLVIAITNPVAATALISAGADVNLKTLPHGWTPLHLAAAYPNACPLIPLLVEKGAGMETRDSLSHTPLMLAIVNRNLKAVEALLALGANLKACDAKGRTPLFYAAMVPSLEDTFTFIHEKAEEAHIPILKALLNAGADIDAVDSNGQTALDNLNERERFYSSRKETYACFFFPRLIRDLLVDAKASKRR